MSRSRALIALLALAGIGLACEKKEEVVGAATRPPAVDDDVAYVGTEECATCHQEAHEEWVGSHHALAMQVADGSTVLGDFSDVKAKYYEETASFTREGDAFFVEALGANGKPRRFPVKYTFGVAPLQQYLVEVAPGRLQSFPFAWDTRPTDRGGQRWFHLQPDEYIEPGDPLHWTGPSYNWNNACADCHSTALHKNYDRTSRSYATEYVEINVGCEACHGRGSRHVELARSDGLADAHGFDRELPGPAARAWIFKAGENIASLVDPSESFELEACARCHSRRADLGGDETGYHDRYRLATLDEVLYFDDGQIQDEVYVYGSFLQSKMHAAGVICSDCHEPHSATLRA